MQVLHLSNALTWCGTSPSKPGSLWGNLLVNRDFHDMLFEFNENNVDYMVVGAYAMAAHGQPRATGDIDLWIRCGKVNAERALAALARFGAPISDLSVTDLEVPGMIFQIGVPPHRIDIITEIDGVAFEEAWTERTQMELYGLTIPVIGRAHLLRNKETAGRPKDLVDVNLLKRET
jgi:hypothetical protein